MEICYYPGCTLKTQAKELDRTARKAMEALGVTVKEIENWRQYRNQIVHAMFSKDIEVLRSNYKEHVEQGYQFGRYVDRQV